MNIAGTCLGVVLCASLVLAQQAPFRGGTELVTIDVVATDAGGQPVRDLTAADFEVLEDGVSQPIQAFHYFDARRLSIPSSRLAGVFDNEEEPAGLFAIVLDELGLSVLDIGEVRRLFTRFLNESVRPGDYVTVVRASADSAFMLSPSRELALDVVANVTGLRDRGLGLEAPGASGSPIAMPGPDALGDDIARFGDVDRLSGGTSGKRSFDVLLDVVEKFRPIQARRKAIIWVSRGGDLSFRNMEQIESGQADGRDDSRFVRLLDAAREGNVAVYALDPTGLSAPPTGPSDPPHDIGPMRDIATATGGRAIVNANDLAGALDRVAEENRSYYLIGYAPQASGTRPRKITVRTRVSQVRLLHRTAYVPPRDRRPAPTTPVIASPLPATDLPIWLAPAVAAANGNRRGLVVPFEIGVDLPDGTEVSYTVVAFDARGRAAARASGRVQAADGRALGTARLSVIPATYQVRVAATVEGSSTQGLAMAMVRVPSGKSDPALCGGFAFEQPGAESSLRVFTRDQPLTMTTLVSAKAEPAEVSFGLGTTNQPPERRWPAAGRRVADGLWQFSFTLKAPLPRGVADISLLQNDRSVGDGCRATFRVE